MELATADGSGGQEFYRKASVPQTSEQTTKYSLHGQRNGHVSHRNGAITKEELALQERVVSQTVSNIINNKQHTIFDFYKVLRKAKKTTNLSSLQTDEGLNILQACLDKGRLAFLPIIVFLGWWKILALQKVPQDATSEHKGRTAKQIAESKRTRKPLDEFNLHNEWEMSLSPLMKSCRADDVANARHLLKTGGVGIFHLDNNNGNALFWVVVSGNAELMDDLVSMGLDVNIRTKKKETLLHVASTLGHHTMVADLLEKYSLDPWMEDISHKSCHDRIAENGDIDTLKAFTKCGVLPKSNVAALAAFAGRSPYLVYLFDILHMSLNSTDMYGRTALHRSLEAGHLGIARYLVEKGADVALYSKMGRNVLHMIAEEGSVESMAWMVTVLKSRSCLSEHLDVQDRYNGVDLCFLIRGRDKGRDAYHYVEVVRSKVPLFMKRTRSGNVDVASFGRVVKSDWGVNPDQDTVDEIEEIFKSRRLNQSAEIDQTPLHVALAKSKFDVAKLLLETGADLHVKDKFGQTALHYAASRGSLELVAMLEKKGANSSALDNSGQNAQQIAEENQHEEIVNFFSARSSYDLVENFRAGPLDRLNHQISHEVLQTQRNQGNSIKQYLADSFREITSEINQLLVKLDSGPVVEETGGDSVLAGTTHRSFPAGARP